ncbi:MAG: zinc metallopeptidase [Candidatus Eisenbacteria bacterium]|nr:zinc metallopeptidase [Candidatus Eisenbacteria bacterium]
MELLYTGFIYFDPLYFLFLAPALLLAVFAQMRVKSTFASMSRVATARGYTGANAAACILRAAGIHDVEIAQTKGWLSDHYDPAKKVLRLSPEVYTGRSVASVGIAAHEAGHALQHATGYAPLNLRSTLVPTASFGSWLAMPMIFIGIFMHMTMLTHLGILLFSALVLFQIITLPVEFNASSRAKEALITAGIVTGPEEAGGVSSVLNAAALTYVAATLTAILQLLYFMFRAGLIGGRND